MIVIIEDAPIQQIIAADVVRHLIDVHVPSSPQELLALPDGAETIIADKYMGRDWLAAREAYIARNPQANVIEWSAGCMNREDECKLGRRDQRIMKTGTGREILEVLGKNPAETKPIRFLETVAAFLGFAVART